MTENTQLDQLLKTHQISQRTYDKVLIAKQYIERKYNYQSLKNKEWNEILKKIDSSNLDEKSKKQIKKEIFNQEVTKYRNARKKISIYDYESISIIGRGAFGEVHVCREKSTDNIVAVKKIKKDVLIMKNQIIHIRNEQLFMSKVKSPWIVELKASFQEDDYLFLVMEYLPGGDLMNLLIKKDILTEDEAKFYISELILCIESIHKLDCIHRDIKPDNVLIDKSGHIKLSDFGLAKISDKIFEENKNFLNNNFNNNNFNNQNTHNKNFSCVGTAYYVAPEVLNKKGYGKEIDWWSVGVIFYEMLVGYAPFCSKETSEVCYKVLNWKKFLKIPNKVNISTEAEDLIYKLISNSNCRLGKNGVMEIKSHPFFQGFNWENIRNMKPPFIPFLQNEYDTSYFETFDVIEPFYPVHKKKFKRKDAEYLGYTFKGDFYDNDINSEYLNAMQMVKNSSLKINDENVNIDNLSIHSNLKIYNKENNNNIINLKNIPIKRSITTMNSTKKSNSNSKIFCENNNKVNKDNEKNLCSIPTSYRKKKKLNIIHLPLKKTKPKNFSTKNMLLTEINDTNNSKNNITVYENNKTNCNYCSRNYSYRCLNTNNNTTNNNNTKINANAMFNRNNIFLRNKMLSKKNNSTRENNNSFLVNNSLKQYLDTSLNTSNNNTKLNNRVYKKLNSYGTKNLKYPIRLSPQPKNRNINNSSGKKYLINQNSFKGINIKTGNNNYSSVDNKSPKYTIKKSMSTKNDKKKIIGWTNNGENNGRNNIRLKYINIPTCINMTSNSNEKNSNLSNYSKASSYVYRKKK